MGQVIAFDTNVFVYLLQRHSIYYSVVSNLLRTVQSGENEGLFANIGLTELLTGYKQFNRYDEAYDYKNLLCHFPNLTITELNEPVIDFASDLRANYTIKTPDAIHLASAIVNGADVFITNDKALKKVKEIKVQLL